MDIDLNTIQSTAPWVLVGIGVVGVVAAIVIKKIVGKIIALVLAAVLIFIGWQQRQQVIDFANSVKDETCARRPPSSAIEVSLPESWCTPAPVPDACLSRLRCNGLPTQMPHATRQWRRELCRC